MSDDRWYERYFVGRTGLFRAGVVAAVGVVFIVVGAQVATAQVSPEADATPEVIVTAEPAPAVSEEPSDSVEEPTEPELVLAPGDAPCAYGGIWTPVSTRCIDALSAGDAHPIWIGIALLPFIGICVFLFGYNTAVRA